MKKKIILGMLVLILLWAGNIIYYTHQQLSEPLFFKHYYDLPYSETVDFQIYYLVNRSTNTEIASISIPGQELNRIYPTWQRSHNTYKYYIIKEACVRLYTSKIKKVSGAEQFQISELSVEFKDGTTQTVNIGQINLDLIDKHYPILDMQSASSSNNNTGHCRSKVKMPIDIIDIDYAFSEILRDVLHITANDQPLSQIKYPFHLSSGESIHIAHAFQFDKKDDLREYNHYNTRVFLIVQSKDGAKKVYCSYIHYTPYFRQRDIQYFIKARRAN